jgi:hypothetical protein
LNEAVRYGLSRRGFFSEFNILAYAKAWCMSRGRTLYLDHRKADAPWRELFSPFPPSVDELEPARHSAVINLVPKAPDGAWQGMRKDVRDAVLERRRVTLPAIDFDGEYEALVFRAARELFRPRPGLVQQAAEARASLGLDAVPYCAVQIRRGDKTEGYVDKKGRLVVETSAQPFAVYADCLNRLAPEVRDVLVLTDDYGAFEAAREADPDRRFHTLCAPDERGYVHADHLKKPAAARLEAFEKLIVSVMLARDSQAFAGTFWSNLSTAVCMLHRDRTRCAAIDPAQEWPPYDPLFLRPRDTL